jgi:hypothetical protein
VPGIGHLLKTIEIFCGEKKIIKKVNWETKKFNIFHQQLVPNENDDRSVDHINHGLTNIMNCFIHIRLFYY